MTDTKRCPRCTQTKPAAEWNRSSASRDGLAGYCRPCSRDVAREWNAANPGRHTALTRAWRAANPERARELSRRAKAAYRAREKAKREAGRAAWLARVAAKAASRQAQP